MTTRLLLAAILTSGGSQAAGQATRVRLNPLVELLEQKKPVFGVYAPSNRRTDAPKKTPLELARETLAYRASDFVFDGSMEGGLERGLPAFTEFVKAMAEGSALSRSPHRRLTHPLVVKTPKIGTDAARATDSISRQLNLGVSGIVFVEVESADEVRRGLAAMRFESKGGTRPDDVGGAPAYWGVSEKEYRGRADLWPLDPGGEQVAWAIVESKEGLAHVDEIAAVKGISVLFPGAGTLRGVFTTTSAAGDRVFDAAGWEAAIQQVLQACKRYHVPCGYPANADDVELRLKQGFSVFISLWGEGGFKAIDIGRRRAGRPAANP